MDDVLLLAEAARQVGADDGMAALDLVVDGLAQVVQEPCALGRDGVEPQLRGHDAREVGHLERVVQHVLAVGGAVAQAAERAHELGMQVVDAGVEGGLLARLLHALVHERLGLAEHLLDARRMDAPVGHEVLHGHAADLAADRVEARDGHALRGVVDDEVRAGELLERADVAALAPDDAALEVIRRDMDGAHRVLGGVVGRHALDGQAQDGAGLLVGLGLRAGLGVADDGGGLVHDLVLESVEQLGFRLLRRHAGHALQAAVDLPGSFLEVALATVELALLGRYLMLAGVERLHAAIERLLALRHAVLRGAHLAHALLVLGLGLLLQLQDLVLCFDDGLATQCFGLSFRVGHHGLGLLRRTFRGRAGQEAGTDEAEGDAYHGTDEQPDDLGHASPFRFGF